MNYISHICAATIALACASNASSATLIATSTLPTYSDFTIEFADANSDGLLQFEEVQSFSGISVLTQSGLTYSYLAAVPTLAGISDYDDGAGGQVCATFCGTLWSLTLNDGSLTVYGFNPSIYTYKIAGLAAIPLPTAMPLLLGGIGALGLLRRRRKVD